MPNPATAAAAAPPGGSLPRLLALSASLSTPTTAANNIIGGGNENDGGKSSAATTRRRRRGRRGGPAPPSTSQLVVRVNEALLDSACAFSSSPAPRPTTPPAAVDRCGDGDGGGGAEGQGDAAAAATTTITSTARRILLGDGDDRGPTPPPDDDDDDEADLAACLSALTGDDVGGNPSGATVMACQYLLRRVRAGGAPVSVPSSADDDDDGPTADCPSASTSALLGLLEVGLPLLLSPPSSPPASSAARRDRRDGGGDDGDDDGMLLPPLARGGVREALMEACFLLPSWRDDDDGDHDHDTDSPHRRQRHLELLRGCCRRCGDAVESALFPTDADTGLIDDGDVYRIVETSCRVLVRLLDLEEEGAAEVGAGIETVLDAMHGVATVATWHAVTLPSGPRTGGGGSALHTSVDASDPTRAGREGLLRPVVALLLPRAYGRTPAPGSDAVAGGGDGDGDGGGNGDGSRRRMDELWNLLSFLLLPPPPLPPPPPAPASPTPTDDNVASIDVLPSLGGVLSGTRRRSNDDDDHSSGRVRCPNWTDAAPSAALGALCVVFGSSPGNNRGGGGGGGGGGLLLPLRPCQCRCTGGGLEVVDGAETVGRVGPWRQPVLHRAILDGLSRYDPSEQKGSVRGGGGTSSEVGGGGGGGGASSSSQSMLRRRSVHVLRLLVQAATADSCSSVGQSDSGRSKDRQRGGGGGGGGKKRGKQQQREPSEGEVLCSTWRKYVTCLEALDGEVEYHLINQVWPTVAELCLAVPVPVPAPGTDGVADGENDVSSSSSCVLYGGAGGRDVDSSPDPSSSPPPILPAMSWGHVSSLMSIVLRADNPKLRKHAVHRLLNGDAGVDVTGDVCAPPPPSGDADDLENTDDAAATSTSDALTDGKKKKVKTKQQKKGKEPAVPEMAPLSIVDVSFVLDVLLPAFDSIGGSSSDGGGNVHDYTDRFGKTYTSTDVEGKMRRFIRNYLRVISSDHPAKLDRFVKGVFCGDFIGGEGGAAGGGGGIRTSTVVLVYDSLREFLRQRQSQEQSEAPPLPLDECTILDATSSLQRMFAVGGGSVEAHRRALLHGFAMALRHGSYGGGGGGPNPDPRLVLRVLALYPCPPSAAAAPAEAEDDDDDDGDDDDAPKRGSSCPPRFIAEEESDAARTEIATRSTLRAWLGGLGGGGGGRSGEKWSDTAGAACAASFVSGHLTLAAGGDGGGASEKSDRALAGAVVRLCTLGCGGGDDNGDGDGDGASAASSSLLWPAIHRGLMSATDVGKNVRAVMLLEFGCLEGALGGMGNGELVQLVSGGSSSTVPAPPPPQIESLLGEACSFVIGRMRSLVAGGGEGSSAGSATPGSCYYQDENREGDGGGGGACRSKNTMPPRLAGLGRTLLTIREAFPSSVVIPSLADGLLAECLGRLLGGGRGGDDAGPPPPDVVGVESVLQVSMCFAALLCGADVSSCVDGARSGGIDSGGTDGDPSSSASSGAGTSLSACRALLHLQFRTAAAAGGRTSKQRVQAHRSAFQVAKWGALCLLVPQVLTVAPTSTSPEDEGVRLVDEVLDEAIDAVDATPEDALVPLFDCAVSAADYGILRTAGGAEDGDTEVVGERMKRILRSLFASMEEMPSNRRRMYMLDRICSLAFRPRLLSDEYHRWRSRRSPMIGEDGAVPSEEEEGGDDGDNDVMPIRGAFRSLMEMADAKKPHIGKMVMCRMSLAWLDADGSGTCAIPYRRDIARLLMFKECRTNATNTLRGLATGESTGSFVAAKDGGDANDVLVGRLPPGTDDQSIVRGFVLLFLANLRDPPCSGGTLPDPVLHGLIHWIILFLLDDICVEKKAGGSSMLMGGSVEYSQKIRAWQALCLLSRFVTDDIAEATCGKVFLALQCTMHGQIRYFAEVFAIQCARRHPSTFAGKFVREIARTDSSLQYVSSLMIIVGNLAVGRYSDEFFASASDGKAIELREVLAGCIPWLSSTQGFSRGIAQLLVHKLIPMVIETSSADKNGDDYDWTDEKDWYLRRLWKFLDEYGEMKRLRKRQSKFFDKYDVDEVCCSLNALLRIPVDEGNEANPLNLVEVIKQSLKDAYLESHENEGPTWKQTQDLLESIETNDNDCGGNDSSSQSEDLLNFQRKIMPLDSLNLALADACSDTMKNAAGRNKQSLIVCATLVDKVPNLGGLARTAEIFAAERLVVPDANVARMDNFKTISVSAGDWIDIEECREANLLSWLNARKEEGYAIVGLEQTSSSEVISKFHFPEKTVLLLGKEKEGIPVEFLHAVDTCVEVPQLGIIRSLNVHVSGAIGIWEYTKQQMMRK